MKKIWIRIVIAGAVVLAIALIIMRPAQELNEIKIGAIFPLTGDAGRIGEMKRQGADLAAEEINAKGGINGRRVTIIYEDSENNANRGIAAFEKLIQLHKTPVIMSAMSGVSIPLVPLVDKHRVVLFANVGHPKISNMSVWVFRDFPTTEQEARVMAEFARSKLKLKKVAILSVNDEWGITGRDSFGEHFTSLGGTVLAQESYEKQDADFRTQLTKIKGANPEAIYVTGFGNALGLIARQYKELDIKGHFLTTTGFNDPEIIALAAGTSWSTPGP